ncbi:MAG TPA: hypothetical protein DDW52_02180 [Planctomycetaceae bacterium]|nr:hypothetical protein [Planctomycetaceae bacterium]
MDRRILRCLILLLSCCHVAWLAPRSVAQESFADALDALEEHRSGLLSYVARITIARYSVSKIPRMVGHRGFSVAQVHVATDKTRGVMVQTKSTYGLENSYLRPLVFLKHPGRFWMSAGRQFNEVGRDQVDQMLDPEVVGIGVCGEINRYFSFEEVLGGYRDWPERFVESDGDVVRFNNVWIDRSKGGSVLHTQIGKMVSVDTSYVKTEAGIWLPQHAFYDCNGDRGMFIYIDWLSVNKPISANVFHPGYVAGWCGLDFEEGAIVPEDRQWMRPPKAQEEPSTPVDSWREIANSYRPIFQQLWINVPLPQIPLRPEAQEAAETFLNENRIDFPDFELLAKDTDSVKSYFKILAARMKQSDKKYREAVEEILTPSQADVLYGRFIVINGLDAFANRAIQARIGMTDEQIGAFTDRRARQRQLAKNLWCNTVAYEKEHPTMPQLDMRSSATLPAIRDFLTKQQVDLVAELTALAPIRTPQRLSFGF